MIKMHAFSNQNDRWNIQMHQREVNIIHKMLVRSTVAQPVVHNECVGMLLKTVLKVVRGVCCVCVCCVCCVVLWCVVVCFGGRFCSPF